MLILPIKKKWFDMILSGEKKEEYREIKPYYRSRLRNEGFLDQYGLPTLYQGQVLFRNGYAGNSPSFEVLCSLICNQKYIYFIIYMKNTLFIRIIK